jgi:hypothetical protein
MLEISRIKLRLAGTVTRPIIERPTSNFQYCLRCALPIYMQANHAEDGI